MTYPTFAIPSTAGVDVGLSVETQPRILRAPFGDGYSQRAGDGLNTMGKKIEVAFSSLTDAEAETIMTFFSDRKGYLPFMWTIPGDTTILPSGTTARQWIAKKWRKTLDTSKSCSVTASFEETFDP